MAHPAETALLILNLISMLSKFSISIYSTFIHLNQLFFFLRSHLCPLCLNTAPSQVLFISFHEYLWNLFFLHSTAVRKKPYSKLLFLKKKAPHLPSCSPFCLSLIHLPHKPILLKHRLDHVTHPLKSLLPRTFHFLKKNAKFLTLI